MSHYRQKILAQHPVAYWRLGDRAGSAAIDATRNGHDGTFVGNPAHGEPGAIRHDPDRAIKLDGLRSYVEITDDAGFSQPASGQGLTVEVWMRPDVLVFAEHEAPEHRYVHWLGKGDKGEYEWGFRFYSKESTRPNRISAYIWNSGGGEGAGAYFEDQLTSGKWIHVVALYDPGDRTYPEAGVSIYRDGMLRGGPTSSPGALYKSFKIVPAHGPVPPRLGTLDRKNFFVGALDEVAIYPRLLSPAEILDHYRSGQ